MPKTRRDGLIRNHDQAQNNLNRFIANMKTMYEVYDPTHSNHATMVTQMATVAENLKGVLQRFKSEMM